MDEATLRNRVREVVRGFPEVVAVYLFGSRARGDDHVGSDYDFGLLGVGRLALDAVVELQCRMTEAIEARVDVVDLRTAGAFLALDVIAGERLLCTNADLCDEYELFVMRRAGDLEPFERELRDLLLSHRPNLGGDGR